MIVLEGILLCDRMVLSAFYFGERLVLSSLTAIVVVFGVLFHLGSQTFVSFSVNGFRCVPQGATDRKTPV